VSEADWMPDTGFDTGIFAHIGLTFPEAAPDRIVGQLDIGPQHLNRVGYVHGGVLCTMIDAAACCAGLYSPPDSPTRYAVTLSLTTQFTRPVRTGRLTVVGKVISANRTIYTGEAHIFNTENQLVAHGIGTFSWRPGSRPEDAPGAEGKLRVKGS